MTAETDYTFNNENLDLIQNGILLFNQEKFWECHEELEHHWLESRGDNIRYVYWAVIQAAACLYHVRQKNLVGARGLLKKTLDKLDKCEQFHIESNLLEKSLGWNDFKNEIRKINDKPELEDFEFLYRFKFKIPHIWSEK